MYIGFKVLKMFAIGCLFGLILAKFVQFIAHML